MRNIVCGKLRFGEGLPKICIPLVGQGIPKLQAELEYTAALPADLYEWRADCYFGDPLKALDFVQKRTEGRPLLCTVRTLQEGGRRILSPEEYEGLLSALISSEQCQLIDIELSCGAERVQRLIALARQHHMLSVVSRHNFQETPPEEEIFNTLKEMANLGADLPKYAVMPQTPRDVLTLLSATEQASRLFGPVITMSMGDLGKISRVSGAYFGSCLTFGAGQDVSAPGQMKAEDLEAVLRDLSPVHTSVSQFSGKEL